MPDHAALEAQLNLLAGVQRADLLNELARRAVGDNVTRALQLSREALSVAREHGDDLRVAESLLNLGAAQLGAADLQAAQASLAGAAAACQDARHERDLLQEQLREQAHTLTRAAQEDALTRLPNRRFFLEKLAIEHARARRANYPLSVALLDLDDFKRVNEAFSYQVGDEVLREVGQLLRRCVHGTDIVARYGGEEFALLLHGAASAEAGAMCEQLRGTVEGHDWQALRPGLRVTLSIGLCDTATARRPECLLAQAEEKLAEAKRGGRNRVRS